MILYRDYLKERDGSDLIFRDEGFLEYKISGEECFLRNTYVKPGYRRSGVFKDMFRAMAKEAFDKGCTYIAAILWIHDPNFKVNLDVSLSLGFKLIEANNNHIKIVCERGDSWVL